MALHLYNTLSRNVEPFEPLDPNGPVGMYCCGPTVHDYAHIGNFRTFVFADLVRRYLEFRGYMVNHVMNITDVEDKIIRRVREQNTTLTEYTTKYQDAFLADLKVLNCTEAHHVPKATDHIPEMIDLIGKLMERSIAYQADDGSVYFSIENYRGCGCTYGRLVNLNFDEMRQGERVSDDEYEKESLADFALWKARVPEDGEVFWPSPWGEGRPGWHIECSAMSMKLLGNTFDLHLGGEDLAFPHHEDEIAQSEGATGQPFMKHWLHGAHLLVEGKKMSKSLGNFWTIREAFESHAPLALRYALLSVPYRNPIDLTPEFLDEAAMHYDRLIDAYGNSLSSQNESGVDLSGASERFSDAMNDDFNTRAAMIEVQAVVSSAPGSDVATWLEKNAGDVLGLLPPSGEVVANLAQAESDRSEVAEKVESLLDERESARASKDWARADEIRDELTSMGVIVEDGPEGPTWHLG